MAVRNVVDVWFDVTKPIDVTYWMVIIFTLAVTAFHCPDEGYEHLAGAILPVNLASWGTASRIVTPWHEISH